MIPLSLTSDQTRSVWHKIALIRSALREQASVREHAFLIGFGSLSRRRDDAEATITLATDQLAAVLEDAAGQMEQRP